MTQGDDWNNVARLGLSLIGVLFLYLVVFGLIFILELARERSVNALRMKRQLTTKTATHLAARNAVESTTSPGLGHRFSEHSPMNSRQRKAVRKAGRTEAAETMIDADATDDYAES
ncbi:hypothetical protein MTO96_029468 [Rhipicephalus appendiculatus]